MLSKHKANFIISLQKKKVREEERVYVIEGDKLVKEFLEARVPVRMLVAKPEFLNSLPQVHGIMNLHGEVIAVYSLAEQFHYPEQEINNIIVASMNGTKIGLEVGNVDEIIDVPDEKVISMPVIMKAVENCFDEVASYAKELIVLIEVSKLMPEAEQQAIQKLVEQQS